MNRINWECTRSASPAGFRLKERRHHDRDHDHGSARRLRRIDVLRQLELLSRSAWLRREVVLAVRANDHVEAMETKGNG
jgi:hypothetical protein